MKCSFWESSFLKCIFGACAFEDTFFKGAVFENILVNVSCRLEWIIVVETTSLLISSPQVKGFMINLNVNININVNINDKYKCQSRIIVWTGCK